jgi:hypothetical protein
VGLLQPTPYTHLFRAHILGTRTLLSFGKNENSSVGNKYTKPLKPTPRTLSTKVPADVADQVLEAANQRGLSRSALLASLIAEHLANV